MSPSAPGLMLLVWVAPGPPSSQVTRGFHCEPTVQPSQVAKATCGGRLTHRDPPTATHRDIPSPQFPFELRELLLTRRALPRSSDYPLLSRGGSCRRGSSEAVAGSAIYQSSLQLPQPLHRLGVIAWNLTHVVILQRQHGLQHKPDLQTSQSEKQKPSFQVA